MLKKFYILFAITIVITACSKNADPSSPDLAPDRSDSGISFMFNRPVSQYVQTYAETVPAGDDEMNTASVEVFMFLADGTFARRLSDIDLNVSDDNRKITLTNGLLAEYRGQSVRLYFVANDAGSTGGAHISSLPETEDEFRELLTKPLGQYVNIAAVNGLLMTSKPVDIYLSDQNLKTIVNLTRRVARFDIHNPYGINVNNIYLSDAKSQTTLFSDSYANHTLGTYSTVVWGPDANDYDDDGFCHSVFYLYPTQLSVTEAGATDNYNTKIAIEVIYKDNSIEIFDLNSDLVVKANTRYILAFDGESWSARAAADNNTNDWEEGDTEINPTIPGQP